MNKKASFVLVSRDDNYCGDSLGRLTNTLNLLGERLSFFNKDINSECILVEWGSNTLKNKLILNNKIKKILKIVEVPNVISKKYQKDSPFSEVHAMNLGFKKSSGDFFIRIDQDTLVGDRFINWFFNEYHVDVSVQWPEIAFSGRRDLSPDQSKNFLNIVTDQKENKKIPITHENHYFNKYTCVKNRFKFYGAAVGAIVIHKNLYNKHRGFNEDLIYMNNMDIEFINRICKNNPIYNLGLDIENDFYHQYHDRVDAAMVSTKSGEVIGKRKTNNIYYREFISRGVNRGNWGLQNEDLNIFQYE